MSRRVLTDRGRKAVAAIGVILVIALIVVLLLVFSSQS